VTPKMSLPADEVHTTSSVIVRSLRLPIELDRRLRTVAERRGIPASTLVRQWVELELVALEDDQLISRADAARALAAVRRSDPTAIDATPDPHIDRLQDPGVDPESRSGVPDAAVRVGPGTGADASPPPRIDEAPDGATPAPTTGATDTATPDSATDATDATDTATDHEADPDAVAGSASDR
jgi:predicted DNA-binding protein